MTPSYPTYNVSELIEHLDSQGVPQYEPTAKLHRNGTTARSVNPAHPGGQQPSLPDTERARVRRVLELARKNDSEFARLAAGGPAGFPSNSEADLSFANMLAQLFKGDPALVDAAFRLTGRMRDKWNRRDYRMRAIALAVERWRMQCIDITPDVTPVTVEPVNETPVKDPHAMDDGQRGEHADQEAQTGERQAEESGTQTGDGAHIAADDAPSDGTEAVGPERLEEPEAQVEGHCDFVAVPPLLPSTRPPSAVPAPSQEAATVIAASADKPKPDGGQESQTPAGDTATGSMFNRQAPYPAPMGTAAYYGVIGEFVHAVEPHTEADPNVLVVLALAYAGNLFGRGAYIWVGGQKHHMNLFANAVGTSSSGRKGSANGPLDLFFGEVESAWAATNQSGLSSGEGLIWCVRDPIFKREKVPGKKGAADEYELVMVDPGVDDKRALVKQPEFFGALQVMRRAGNTLSSTIRDAWDRGDLRSMTKNSPAKATGAHITIIGNITKEELLRGMLGGEMDNGFANRFLWLCSKRSKELPEGGRLHELMNTEQWRELVLRIQKAKAYAFNAGAIFRDEQAADLWGRDGTPGNGMYHLLSGDRHGLFGAATSRAAPQVLRLALIYAALDCAREIGREHLEAALAVWKYCEDSAKYIFGDSLGDPTADTILKALRQHAGGLTRQDISTLFFGNQKASEIQRALQVLHSASLARFEVEEKEGKGRPPERWYAVGNTTVAQ